MIILRILCLILFLAVVPACMGLICFPLLGEQDRRLGTALISGYIVQFGLVELIGIPVVICVVYNGFSTFTKILVPVLILLSLLGVGAAFYSRRASRTGRRGAGGGNVPRGSSGYLGGIAAKGSQSVFRLIKGKTGAVVRDISLEGKILWILFLALVMFQIYMAFTRTSFDGDDAYYGGQALAAQQVDTLYRVNPYTGRSTPLDVRHALALFPIWEALVGRVSGIHVTVICHSIIPLVFIPLTYLIYYQVGRTLLAKKRELLPMFMLLLGLWQVFGNISLYTTETFFLTRTWQGKSFAGNFVIPAVVWIFLQLYEDEKRLVWWVLLGILNLAGGASSSLAVLLSCLMTLGFGFLFAVGKKNIWILIKSGISCVCGGGYVLVYLLLTHGFLGV